MDSSGPALLSQPGPWPHRLRRCDMANATCSIDGCDKGGRLRRGWCTMHYSRWVRHGDPGPAESSYRPAGATCTIKGCDNPHRAKGWCQAHYMRHFRLGDVMADEPLPGAPHESEAVRFWSKVDRGQDWACWEWTGARGPSGHGRFRFEDRSEPAHRVVYRWTVGPIPAGLEIDHLCRNPPCVNPSHLEAVTPDENKRRIPPKTHCPQGHEYTAENTRYRQNGHRVCRACDNERCREYHRRKSSAA